MVPCPRRSPHSICTEEDSCAAAKLHLLDHVVGSGKQRWRDFDTECFCGLEIDDQFELCRLLYWKISGLRPLEYLVYVTRGSVEHVWDVRPVGDKTTGSRKAPVFVDRRDAAARNEIENPIAMEICKSLRRDQEGFGPLRGKRNETGFETVQIARAGI